MSLNTKGFTNFAEKRTAYADSVKSGMTAEEQADAFSEMMDALSND